MAVKKLTVGKPPKPTYGKNSFYAPLKPKLKVPAIVKPKLPAGMTINKNQSDAAYEQQLQGGGAWGAYSPGTVASLDKGWDAGAIAAPGQQRPKFQDYIAGGIPGDWEVGDAEAAFASRMAALRAGFQGNLRKSLIDMGLADTSKLGQFGSYIDQDTITAAINNKYSTAAQIAQQENTSRSRSEAALAARGILSSGQTTKNAEDISAEGEKGRYAALQQFLSAGQEGLTGIASQEQGLLGDVARARANAAERLAQQYGWDFSEEEAEGPVGTSAGSAGGPATVAKAAKKPPKAPPKYNPKGYVPGGASKAVAKAIVKKATTPPKKKK